MTTVPRTTRLLGYADPLVTTAGGRIAVKVGGEDGMPYRAEIVRFSCCDPDPRGPGLRYAAVEDCPILDRRARPQEIVPGSLIRIDGPSVLNRTTRFAFAAMVFPTLPGGRAQTLAGLWDDTLQQGWSLGIDAAGMLSIRIGGSGSVAVLASEVVLPAREWSFVALRLDLDAGHAELLHEPLQRQAGRPAATERRASLAIAATLPPTAPFLFAASGRTDRRGGWQTIEHYDGKIDQPRLAAYDTPHARLRALVGSRTPQGFEDCALAVWDFARDIPGRTVRDLGPCGLDGVTVNCPARAVTGHTWDGSCEDWRAAPELYGAIHFHHDDLYDCGWDTDFEIVLPAEARSGFHAVRLTAPGCETFIPFFVAARPGRAQARIAVVAATATYLAYANTHVKFDSLNSENLFESVMQVGEQEAYLNEHRELGYSTYDVHADGSGVFYSSWLRPLLTMQPGVYTFNYVNDSHVLAWLDAIGEPYDLVTDHDLHRHGLACLQDYAVVITASHPEYFSTRMWDALYAYQQRGGRHMYLGGNGFYWRTGFSDAFPAAIEMRRGITGVRTWEGEPGESHLGFSGEPGGLWRSLGRAPQRLCGVGFSATLFNRSTFYRRTPASLGADFAFVFEGIGAEEWIGDFGLRGGGAAGLEIDRWDPLLGSPASGAVLATSQEAGIGGLLTVEEFITTTRALDAEQHGHARADLALFETPAGGAVFSVGSIAWPTSLSHNEYRNNVARLTGNVLARFLDPTPLRLGISTPDPPPRPSDTAPDRR